MSNRFWAADGDMDRQNAFAFGPKGNAGGADDEAAAVAERNNVSGQTPRWSEEPASLTPGQKVGDSAYASFRPQLAGAETIGNDGGPAACMDMGMDTDG